MRHRRPLEVLWWLLLARLRRLTRLCEWRCSGEWIIIRCHLRILGAGVARRFLRACKLGLREVHVILLRPRKLQSHGVARGIEKVASTELSLRRLCSRLHLLLLLLLLLLLHLHLLLLLTTHELPLHGHLLLHHLLSLHAHLLLLCLLVNRGYQRADS